MDSHQDAAGAAARSPAPSAGSPVRLVTFDLYDTLIELAPPRWERLAAVCARLGIAADPAALLAADTVAEDYYTEENTLQPIRDRDQVARGRFRLAYMARWLAAAGLPHDQPTVATVRRAYLAEFEAGGGEYRVFPDVLPAVERLRAAGVRTAIVSNADADVTELCTHLAFAHAMDLIVTSALVGWEKPDPRTFRAALDPLGVDPADALHVGDQPRSDVVGALGVGMRAALLDRYGRQPEGPAPRVAGLMELVEVLGF